MIARLRSPAFRGAAALLAVLIVGLIWNAHGAFFHFSAHRDVLRQVSVYGILACGMTLVIVCGGIDLAAGSYVGLFAVVYSELALHAGLAGWESLALVLLAGGALGVVAGFLTGKLGLQSFIATLAMMVFARGLAKFVSGGEKITSAIENPDGTFTYHELPHLFHALGGRVGAIPVVGLIFLGCVAVSWVVLERLRYGTYIYAVGGNEEAARLSGVPVLRVKLFAYGLSGLFGAVAGICQAVQEQQGDPEAGNGYELTAIAIAVIGGNSLGGGVGGMGLTLIGALTVGYIEKILSLNSVGEASRLMMTAGIIVGAVLLQRRRQRVL